MTQLRALVADDHALVRCGIRALLEDIDEVQVVADVGNGVEALRLIEEHAPDILFLDISMPGLNGFEVLEKIGKKFPEVRTIVLTVHESEQYAMRALNLGAMGYVAKSADRTELELAIETVARKEKYISAELSRKIFFDHTLGAQGHGPLAALTSRQLQVLQLIAEGLNAKGIALRLGISVKTVESHRTNLMERLNIHHVAGLVRYSIRMGLVRIDDGP